MANFNNLSLTSSGVKALLEAQAGKTLTLSKIGLGSGSTTSGIVSLKALVTPELMIPISETIIDSTEGYKTVIAKITNKNMTEGFYWKETGLFFKDDNDEDILFAYACITDDKYDYIPAFSDQRYVKNIRIANIVTDTDNITVEESEGLMYVDTVTFNAFKDEVVKYNDVVDNLLSESDNLPLSAKQGKVLKESVDQLNSDLDKQYVQGGTALTQNLNGYFRQANVTFPVQYKAGTTPNVCITVCNYQNSAIDVRLVTLVKDVSNTGFSAFVADNQGEIGEMGYEVEWISVGQR